tara:strand:- start:1972 stop:3255 length:1284 start_codon:yes stop_codon:yes gene_type:complete
MLKEIPFENVNIRPFVTHKTYVTNQSDYTLYSAVSASIGDWDLAAQSEFLQRTPAFDNNTLFDPINESKTDIFFQRALYHSINAKYYHPSNKSSVLTGAGRQHPQFAYGNQRLLSKQIEILAVSQSKFGEEIQPGSVELTITSTKVDSNELKVVDDGYGNLLPSSRAAKITLFDAENGLINFEDFDGNQYKGTTDNADLESGSLNVLTLVPQGSADTRATAMNDISILTMDFQCGIILFGDEDNPFEDVTNWSQWIVGNVFYDDGLLVMTDSNCTSLEKGYTLRYRATHTIYEHEFFLEVGDCEFNYSQNPTAIKSFTSGSYNFHTTPLVRGGNTGSVKITENFGLERVPYYSGSVTSSATNDWVSGSWDDYWDSGSTDLTGSYLAPFITTIGLYNSDNEMLGIAKLPKPIKNLPDYPVNFIVRIDV